MKLLNSQVALGLLLVAFQANAMYYDAESKLIYNVNRYYDAEDGRYISSDPIGLEGGLNTYAYAYSAPTMYIDPFGLESEIVIWQPVGWGGSSFGHVSTNINGTTYSFGPGGMWIGPTAAYMAKNNFRAGVGTTLKLTPQQEQQFQACLEKPQGNYGAVSNNCGAPAQYCLQNLGINLGGFNPLPVNLGNNLINKGLGQKYTVYPASSPAAGGSAIWAK